VNEQQISEYIEFINELLACEFVTKAILYQKYSRLVDEALPKVMEIYATTVLDPSSKMYLSDRRALLTESKTLTKNIGDWYQLNSQAFELSNQGEIAATITILQQALELARDNLPIPNKYQVGSLNNLAGLYRSQGRWTEAEPLYKRALAICEELSGDSLRDGTAERPNDAVAATWTSLARLDELQRQSSAKAGLLYKRALAIREELSGERPNDLLATTLNNLAKLYELQGRSAEAGSLYKQALPGDGELNNWNQLNSQANQLYRQGKFAAAIPIAQQALELAKKSFPVPNNLWEALSLNTLGSLYKSQVRWTEAEPLLDRALAICEKLFGEQPNEYLATCLNSLAELYKSQGRWAEAEPLYQRALAIFVELFGERPNDALHTCLNNLAKLYELQGRSAEIESLYERALQSDGKLDNWNQLNSQANELYRQGEIAAAIPIAQQALELAQKSFLVPNQDLEASSLNTLGVLYTAEGRLAEAEPLLDRALAICEELFGNSLRDGKAERPHEGLATCLNSLAELYKAQGRWAEAEPLYKRALAIFKELSGERPNVSVAVTLNNLAGLYELQGRSPEAELLHERVVQDGGELDNWNQLNSQAAELYRQGEIIAAIPIAQQALELARKSAPIPNNPLETYSLNLLGVLYKSQGRWTEAEPLLDRALAIHDEMFGDRPNKDLANSLNSLAELYRSQGRWAEAEPLYNRALAIFEELFGDSLRDGKAERPNGNFAACLNNLAELHNLQGRWSIAEEFHERALAMYEELFGDRPNNDLASSLNNLAGLYENRGRWAEAEPLLERALAIRQELFGDRPNHDLAISLKNLGTFYVQQGRWAEAEPLYDRALAINEELFGDRPNDNLALSLNNLALIYKRQGRWAEAESMYDRALVINEELFGERPNHYLEGNLTSLAQLYESQGRWAEAEPLYVRAQAINEKLFGNLGHPNLVRTSINLALFHARQQQPDKSLLLLQQAIEFENSWLKTVIAASDRQQRLKDLEQRQVNLEYLLSLTQQYFPSDPAAVTAALNAVLSRKAQATATEAAVNQAIQQNPELAPDLQQLKTYKQEIADLSYAIANQPELKDRLNTLDRQKNKLERRLGRSIPAIDLAQQVVDRQALTSILPPAAFLVEFIRYRPYDFIHKQWQPARYLAFIVPPNSAEGVMAIDCGIAKDLDLAIDKFRRAYADIDFSGEHSGMGSQTVAEPPAPQGDRQFQSDLLDQLLPHLPATGTCYLATDGYLQILPFHLLKTAEDEYLGDRYRLHYLTTARDLLRHQCVPTSTNPPLILADPDYDGGIAPTPSTHPKTGLQISDRLDGQRFDRLLINRQFGERVARSYGATCHTDIEATVNRLERLNAPRLLFIATHGFSLPAHNDLIETIQNCVGNEEETILRNRSSEITPAFRAYWQKSADAGNEWCQRIVATIDDIGIDLQPPDLLAQPADDPMLRSGIALAGANIWRFQGQEDPQFGKGVIFADDITQWNLWGNELSVLVTCVSGLGAVSNSEGVFGLRRALGIAGAKYVISSLWNIPTKPSVLLMNKFFEIYQSATKPTPAVALAQSQAYIRNITLGELNSSSIGREIIRELLAVRALSSIATDDVKPLADPYFWGAWICQG
jgi:tetratricopeptide (TPR) repeat protein